MCFLLTKDVSDTRSEGGQHPLLEVLGPGGSLVGGSLKEAVDARPPFIRIEPVQIVLEGIGNKPFTKPHPAFPLVTQPAVLPKGLVHVSVKRFVVRELDVPPHVPRESRLVDKRTGKSAEMVFRLEEMPFKPFRLGAACRLQEKGS